MLVRLLCISLLTISGALAQNALNYTGARSWGMGNAMVALPNHQSFFGNPAGLAFLDGTSVSSSYDSRFELADLNTVSITALRATKRFAVSVGAERFGDRRYNETKIGLALAKSTGRVALGVKASYLGAVAENYTSTGTLYTEFAVLAKLHPSVQLGFLAKNITGARWFASDPLPTELVLGGAFSPTRQILFTADAGYIPGVRWSFRSGLEYAMKEQLFLRTGINPVLKTNHFGVGYAFNPWTLDYAVNTHPSLGLSHHLSLNFKLEKKP